METRKQPGTTPSTHGFSSPRAPRGRFPGAGDPEGGWHQEMMEEVSGLGGGGGGGGGGWVGVGGLGKRWV